VLDDRAVELEQLRARGAVGVRCAAGGRHLLDDLSSPSSPKIHMHDETLAFAACCRDAHADVEFTGGG